MAAAQHRKQVIELGEAVHDQCVETFAWEATMLSEKFFLILETLRSHGQPDGSTRVVSTSRHVPIKLPERADKS